MNRNIAFAAMLIGITWLPACSTTQTTKSAATPTTTVATDDQGDIAKETDDEVVRAHRIGPWSVKNRHNNRVDFQNVVISLRPDGSLKFESPYQSSLFNNYQEQWRISVSVLDQDLVSIHKTSIDVFIDCEDGAMGFKRAIGYSKPTTTDLTGFKKILVTANPRGLFECPRT